MKTTIKNSNTKKTTSKKNTTNQNKKSIETSKDITHKEPNKEPKESNDSSDSLNKNKLIKKQKKIMWILIGTLLALLSSSVIIPSIIVSKTINENNNQIVFNNSDFVYLRQQIINLVNKEHMSLKSFEKVMVNVFKEYLLASNTNISKLIQKVEIQNYQTDSITFKITLDSNYKYGFINLNNEIIISDNNLFITYSSLNSIKFYD